MLDNRRKIRIKQTAPFHLLPEGVKSEVTNSIGSKFARGSTGSLLMGLNEVERRYILPSIIETDPKSEHWEKNVKMFYADLTIFVDPELGTELDITTKEKDVYINGELKKVNFPLVPLDYVKYKQCLVDKTVAKDFEGTKSGICSFYIEDQQAEEIKRNKQRNSINVIMQDYLDLVKRNPDGSFADEKKLKYVLRVLGINPDVYTNDNLESKLETFRDTSIQEIKNGTALEHSVLYKVSRDSNIKDKAFIIALVDKGILSIIGGSYVDSDNYERVLGSNLDQAVVFLNNQNNLELVQKYKLRLRAEKV